MTGTRTSGMLDCPPLQGKLRERVPLDSDPKE